MKEKDFEKKVKAFLKDRGCWVLKTWSNGVQRQGIPDLLVCCNGYFVGVELKADKGKPSELQKYNIDKIRESGGIAIILYPEQFEEFKGLMDDLIFDMPILKHCPSLWESQQQIFYRKETE